MLIAASSPTVDDPGLLLRTRLTGFAGFLRANGYGVGGGDSTRFLETASRVGVFDGDVLRWSLKALLCGRGDEWRRFDALYDAYFLPPNRKAFAETPAVGMHAPEAGGASKERDPPLSIASAGEGGAHHDDGHAERHGASREETLASTDFGDLVRADQLRDIEALMRRFARAHETRAVRREARLRAAAASTFRARYGAASAGGTPFRLAEGSPPRAPAPRAAARREPLDEPVQFLLSASRVRFAPSSPTRIVFIFTRASPAWAKRCAIRIHGGRRKGCICWPPAGAGARASANACRISAGATARASCIRARA
jgi:hypothetical protein